MDKDSCDGLSTPAPKTGLNAAPGQTAGSSAELRTRFHSNLINLAVRVWHLTLLSEYFNFRSANASIVHVYVCATAGCAFTSQSDHSGRQASISVAQHSHSATAKKGDIFRQLRTFCNTFCNRIATEKSEVLSTSCYFCPSPLSHNILALVSQSLGHQWVCARGEGFTYTYKKDESVAQCMPGA